MSTERMTDARALETICRVMNEAPNRDPIEAEPAILHIAARLRGEAAPEGQAVAPDAVLIGPAVCYGGDGDGGGDWFKELTVEGVTFLAPLDDYERAMHILAAKKRRPQPAAPAPVAGDVVAAPSLELRADNNGKLQLYRTEFNLKFAEFAPGVLESERRVVFAALAQDRAAQAATQPPAVGVDVTDEMVERAHAAYWGEPDNDGEDRPAMRAALTAALRTGGGES